MIRRPPRSTRVRSSAASDVYKRQDVRHRAAVRDRAGRSGHRRPEHAQLTGDPFMTEFPDIQNAIEIYGGDQVRLNPNKPVPPVGPKQILLKIEASGICFSDTKLMHAFDHHPRKSEVLAGLTAGAVSYTHLRAHETVLDIV